MDIKVDLLSDVVDQSAWSHSFRLSLSFGCKVSGLRGGEQRSDTQSATRRRDDSKPEWKNAIYKNTHLFDL